MQARHCWIYRSDVTDASKAQPGDVVRVVDPRGRVLGSALYSSRSQIALRMISFEDVEIDRDFWLARLRQPKRCAIRSCATRLLFGWSTAKATCCLR